MASLLYLILQHLKCWQNVLMFVVFALLFTIQFSIPLGDFSLIDVSIADGNGTLSLGTWGYCLYLPNKDCHHLLHKIGQFFLLP